MRKYIENQYKKLCDHFPKMRCVEAFIVKNQKKLKKIFIVVGCISILISLIEIPREIYRAVRNHGYYHDLGNRDYWPVHDYYGNNVNIFEFEDYLEDCGAQDIIKGYYYKGENTSICYDFKAGGMRILLDNDIITGNSFAGYNSIFVQSNLSIYDGDRIYRMDYITGQDYVMDYRSPMWVERRVFNTLHEVMDDIKEDEYDHSKCPFAGMGISHYEEDADGNKTWHDDVY